MISAKDLRPTVERLSAWPTRNSNRAELDEALSWLQGQFSAIPGCVVRYHEFDLPAGKRVPVARRMRQLIADLIGNDPAVGHRVLMLGAHADTFSREGIDAPAPGANDDASGVALLLAVARAMAHLPRRRTVRFAVFTAEEQGLVGSAALAETALAEGRALDGFWNFDMVANATDDAGARDTQTVRLFSDVGPARELARYTRWTTRQSESAVAVRLVLRPDRYGRGGDHTPFARKGFAAVRFTEEREAFSRQHSAEDTVEFMDFEYLAAIARHALAVAVAAADAPPAPTEVLVDTARRTGSRLTWSGDPEGRYRVYSRETTSPVWQDVHDVHGFEFATEQYWRDDHEFAVGAGAGIPVPAV